MSTKDHAVVPFDPTRFTVEMPNNAPPVAFDVNDPGFNWRMVMPSNFWSIDGLKERKAELGGWPVLTPARIVVKPVYDPSDYDDNKPIPPQALTPKLVMEFAEASPALVLNKSRCEIATTLTGTSDPRQWAERLGPVMLLTDIYNGKGQIIFERAPVARATGKGNGKDKSVDDLNQELFG